VNDKPPYRNWLGVVLGFLLHGSAHFLSGKRTAGLKWYFGLFACGVVAVALVATPGTIPFIVGVAFGLASVVLWLVMLKQSYRPVRRIGFLGWLAVIVLAVVLNNGLSLLVRQFVHPFRVPTGAMQPTIFGIHGHDVPVDSEEKPGVIRWLVSGRQYVEVKAESSGILSVPRLDPENPSRLTYMLAAQTYELPRFATPLKQPGEHVSAGDMLWSGIITAGDHLFVERLSYRFGKPKRGDIVVFRTKGIESLPPDAFYIKRVAGLPGERIRIEPPFLIVSDQKVTEPEIFDTISSESDGYAGFQLADPLSGVLSKATDEVTLGRDEYFVLGDNTRSSLDSRYWGPVPEKNIIGRATRIYWPFTRINALDEKVEVDVEFGHLTDSCPIGQEFDRLPAVEGHWGQTTAGPRIEEPFAAVVAPWAGDVELHAFQQREAGTGHQADCRASRISMPGLLFHRGTHGRR
jgi:signal peptidase I